MNSKSFAVSFEHTANPKGWNALSMSIVPIMSTGYPCHISLYVASAAMIVDNRATFSTRNVLS